MKGFVETLQQWQDAEKTALVMLDAKGNTRKTVSYKKLWTDSGILATHFLNEGMKPKQRVMIMYPITSVIEYLTAFVACLRIGVTPVSIYPPNPAKIDQDLKTFAVFLDNAQSAMAITTLEYKRFVQISSLTKTWPPGIKKWLATDQLVKQSVAVTESRVVHLATDDELAFIQYTSGSTGNPKGVPVHHRSLMNSLLYSTKYFTLKGVTRTFIWCPIYHDYGLIDSLMTLFNGTELYLLDPISYIQNPLLWPLIVEKYAIHFTLGPNFSYSLTARKLKDSGVRYNCSSLVWADIAAEPIQKSTIDDMINVWNIPRDVIYHSYGMAECCVWTSSVLSYFDPETGIAACGETNISREFGIEFVIANKDTLEPVPDGVTGEVFVHGVGLVKEYWRNPEASRAFQHSLKGRGEHWYHSGDLGYLKEGRLFLTGRSKDVIIVNGKNIYASDIELRVEEELAQYIRPGCSAAFQTGDDTVAVLCEFRPGQEKAFQLELLQRLKGDLELEFGCQFTDILCCAKGTVPKTTSGKLRRSEAKRMFLAGEVKSQSKLTETRKCTMFVELLEMFDVVDMDLTLIENGVDSLKLTRLIEEAHSQFHLTIDFQMAQEVPCKDLESAAIKRDSHKGPEMPPIPECQPTDATMRLFVFWQAVGLVLLLLVAALCTIPAAYTYQWITSSEFVQNHLDLVDPYLSTFDGGPGLLLLAIPLVWMAALTIAMVVLKWTVIGRFRKRSHAIWSPGYFRWWFIHRLVSVWELFVGSYLIDTPLLNLIYIAMGSRIPVFTCRLKTFVREFDLLQAEDNTCISGYPHCSLVDARGLVMDELVVKANTALNSMGVYYPGQILDAAASVEESKQDKMLKPATRASLWVQLQRVLFLPLLVTCYLASVYFFSWGTSFWRQNQSENAVFHDSVRLIICFYGNNLMILVFSSLLCRLFGSTFDYTVDRLAALAYLMLDYWVNKTQLTNVIHRVLFGTKISWKAQINSFYCIAPSQGRFVTIDQGATVSYSSINASSEKPVRIHEGASIGFYAAVEEGVTVGKGSSVATLAHVDRSVPDNTSYFSSSFQTKSLATPVQDSNTIRFIVASLLTKLFFQWCTVYSLFFVTIWATFQAYLGVQSWPLYVQTPVLTLVATVVGGSFFAIINVFLAQVCVPAVPKDGSKLRMSIYSLQSALYYIHIANHASYYAYCQPFVAGTFVHAFHEKMCGANIQNLFRCVLFGLIFDHKYISLLSTKPAVDDDQTLSSQPDLCAHDSDPGWQVMEMDSTLEAHSLEYGTFSLGPSVLMDNCSIHPLSVVMSQHVSSSVTLAAKCRVFFTNSINKNYSGIYTGIPGGECR
ncbi:hypothetical protein HDU91_006267 [Kappamyces sp. JEL0680]|nr:hypothetical protein HDU91_006267 [Kappamyces sp. JEL0680]